MEQTEDNSKDNEKQKSPTNNDNAKELEESLSKLTLNEEQSTKEEPISKYDKFITHLKNGDFKNIVFMTGAGISTSAGIPDFRSKNGLFKQLQEKYNLSTPEEFFDIQTFLNNPKYFYEFYKEFDSKTYNPTIFHYFMGFLCHKKYVQYVFTQNIDGLDHKCGIDEDKLIFAHGNFDEGHCPRCQKDVDIELIRNAAINDTIYECSECKIPCKPKIVFYREDLPRRFYNTAFKVKQCDLGIVCGTSLLVGPFNSLPYMISKYSWRVVINRSSIGDTKGKRGFEYEKEDSNDLLIKGYSDEVVKQIVKDCEWEKEFEEFINETKKKYNKINNED